MARGQFEALGANGDVLLEHRARGTVDLPAPQVSARRRGVLHQGDGRVPGSRRRRERRGEAEMAAEVPGRWCGYGLFFNWSPEISAMHFTCAIDLKVPEKRRAALYELLGAVEKDQRLARIFASLGTRKIRLTGGEPLLRRDMPALVTAVPDTSSRRKSV